MGKDKTKCEPFGIEYEPYGSDWEKEMMKLPKKLLISMYKKKCLECGERED